MDRSVTKERLVRHVRGSSRARSAEWALKSACLFASLGAISVFAQTAVTPDDLLRRQSEQIQDIKARNDPQSAVRSDEPETRLVKRIPVAEVPCIPITTVQLTGEFAEDLANALAGEDGHDSPRGKCIGSQGVQVLIDRVQNALVARGLITTRVHAPDQDLNSGTLVLEITPGRVGAIRAADSTVSPIKASAYAFSEGQVLNLRDVEQTVENVRRLAGADLKVEIVPSENAGFSDLVLSYAEGRSIWANLGVDDTGSRSTGKWQGNLALHWDNPLNRADSLYLGVGGDLGDRWAGPRGTDNHLVSYSIPFGHWSLQGSASRSRYTQEVAGAFQNYTFHGRSADARLKLERVAHRSADARTMVSLEGFSRRSENYIDDTEVLVQRRRTGGWELSTEHTQYLPASTWSFEYRYRRGTGAFGAIPAPEEIFNEGTSRMRLSQVLVRYQTSWPALGLPGQAPGFSSVWRSQWAHTPLTPQDRFCFGGRHTVRGFDGASNMCGDSGWTSRNEVTFALPEVPVQLYAAIDAGRARGPSAPPSSWLLGWVTGFRSSLRLEKSTQLQLDAFIGIPLRKPSWFSSSDYTGGFNLQVLF